MEGYIGKVKLSNILFNDATCVYTYTHMCVCMHRVSRVDRRSYQSGSSCPDFPTRVVLDSDVIAFQRAAACHDFEMRGG